MKLKFIDLFAGIGGFHLGLSRLGMECVAAVEKDSYARKTYKENFKLAKEFPFYKDITNIYVEKLPDFDIVCGGFPCQPFSLIGKKKGFSDSGRGNLFFNIRDIIREKRPVAYILENVKNIEAHDGGKTLNTIKNELEGLGYSFFYKVLSASDYGLPQMRRRAFFVGFDKNKVNEEEFLFPAPVPLKMTMSDVFGGKCTRDVGYTLRVGGRGSGVGDRRNWDGYVVDGKEVRLSIEHGKKMMGFPKSFLFPVTDRQAFKQLGNSVAVPCVESIGKCVKDYIAKNNK